MSDLGTGHLTRDATTLGYVFAIAVVNQLGAQRRRLAELAERQRDELANEIQLAAEVQQGTLGALERAKQPATRAIAYQGRVAG